MDETPGSGEESVGRQEEAWETGRSFLGCSRGTRALRAEKGGRGQLMWAKGQPMSPLK